ncbi:MAG: zinc ribbon domain-containing protein [Candidatus Eremiobacteraeota bacterium]|nr:zinc ribbon domain-containing protein [Candidatus Eremiobacteraeota bacterium]
MPIYCYKCESCGTCVEEIHRADEHIEKECSDCGGKMEKIISPVAVIFKGSGFHVNDYKREHITKEKPAPKEGEGKAETGSADSPAQEPSSKEKPSETPSEKPSPKEKAPPAEKNKGASEKKRE